MSKKPDGPSLRRLIKIVVSTFFIAFIIVAVLANNAKAKPAYEWVLEIFTAMPPDVKAKLQEIVVTNCPALVETIRPSYEATKGLLYTLECEKRSKKKKK